MEVSEDQDIFLHTLSEYAYWLEYRKSSFKFCFELGTNLEMIVSLSNQSSLFIYSCKFCIQINNVQAKALFNKLCQRHCVALVQMTNLKRRTTTDFVKTEYNHLILQFRIITEVHSSHSGFFLLGIYYVPRKYATLQS